MEDQECRAIGRYRPYRSWGEQQIALLMDREGIGYQYEYPLAMMDEGKVKLYYPDFTLPCYGLIIEYFGVRNSPDYERKTSHKMTAYRKAGIETIVITNDSFKGDWPSRIMGQIEHVLQSRVERFGRRKEGVKK
jgi:hypothetical protein